ncbi:tyrosine-type recombinase/integrase [Geobacter benzoatilyticus]|uniref:Integrase domain-containing protein n=1 Tax=Geobacter benzoatilyticus TaxID=2815309 RepID=A0ABX7Q260_9BACT|nr:tyrosine-type recombinase/integrase [Geobacter benzoatilyticus]QSV45424.1 integrase domain-containing protein [Geobacter benzoatilyticus]
MSSKLGNEAKKLVGKNYGKGSGTTEKLLGNIERIAEFMGTQGLQSIHHMKTKHVSRFFNHLKAEGVSASTMANYATAMRRIAHAIGKDNIVPSSNAELGINRSDRYQPKHGDNIKMEEVREALYGKNEWQGLAIDMQRVFGLRVKESLLSQGVVVHNGREFLVVEGSKGGRPRELEVKTDEQREVLQRVGKHIAATGGKTLIPLHLTLKQALKKQANDLHRTGGTKANMANSHLARHHTAQKMDQEGASNKEIAEYLGHGREGVTRHYK